LGLCSVGHRFLRGKTIGHGASSGKTAPGRNGGGKRLKAGGVGIFYFSGRGVQLNGYNYLIPIGSTIEKEQDVAYEAVEAGRVLSEMEAAENVLNIRHYRG
jgi:hypothetical protein